MTYYLFFLAGLALGFTILGRMRMTLYVVFIFLLSLAIAFVIYYPQHIFDIPIMEL